MKTVRDIELANKRVLIRVDFNLPMENGQIVDDFRLRVSLDTLKYCVENQAKVILMSHLGRPQGQKDPKFSLLPVANRLSQLMNQPVKMLDDCIGPRVKKEIEEMKNGEIVLLENLRFHPEEEANDPDFAKQLSSLADIYINDAFGSSHRNHVSIVGLPRYLPSVAGLLLEKEVKILSQSLKSPQQPAIAILGGAKIEIKLPTVESLAKKYDQVLIGGKIANEIVDGKIPVAGNVRLPLDYVFEGEKKLDIGPKTIDNYKKIISQAKTIIWNGPMGVFEKEKFAAGTEEIAQAIAKSSGYSVVGGGETIEVLNNLNLIDKIDLVSTGGGAMLEFLAGKELPGIKVLE